jgi:hypothetical protein
VREPWHWVFPALVAAVAVFLLVAGPTFVRVLGGVALVLVGAGSVLVGRGR